MSKRTLNQSATHRLQPTLPQSQLPFEPIFPNEDLNANTVLHEEPFVSPSIFPGPYRGNLQEAIMLHQPSIQQDYTNEQLNNLLTVAEISLRKQNMSIDEIIYLTELKLRLVYIQKHRKQEFSSETMLRVNYIIALIGMVLKKRHNIQGGKQSLSRNSRRAKKNKTNKRKKRKSVNNKKRSRKKISRGGSVRRIV